MGILCLGVKPTPSSGDWGAALTQLGNCPGKPSPPAPPYTAPFPLPRGHTAHSLSTPTPAPSHFSAPLYCAGSSSPPRFPGIPPLPSLALTITRPLKKSLPASPLRCPSSEPSAPPEAAAVGCTLAAPSSLTHWVPRLSALRQLQQAVLWVQELLKAESLQAPCGSRVPCSSS